MTIVKYVIQENRVPLLFNPRIMHSEAIDKWISAGFAIIDYDVIIDTFKVKCYGCSDSLQLSSHEGDDTIVKNYLNELLGTMTFDSIVAHQRF